MLHPRAVLPVRVNRQVISPSIIASVNTFFVFYLFCILAGWILLMFFGVGIIEAMSTVISSLGNVGPGLGHSVLLFHGRRCLMLLNGYCRS